MKNRRKVLFTDGMSNDFLLIITDAPEEDIEDYCRWHNYKMEAAGHFEMFAPLKAKHYVKELLDSEVDDLDDVDIIGYDVCYDFGQYTKLNEKGAEFRTVKITSGMIQYFEIISTDAPDHVIKAQLIYISACEEEGRQVPENPYGIIEEFGYTVNCLGCQDDFRIEDRKIIIDAEFDYYDL